MLGLSPASAPSSLPAAEAGGAATTATRRAQASDATGAASAQLYWLLLVVHSWAATTATRRAQASDATGAASAQLYWLLLVVHSCKSFPPRMHSIMLLIAIAHSAATLSEPRFRRAASCNSDKVTALASPSTNTPPSPLATPAEAVGGAAGAWGRRPGEGSAGKW
eukprot:CAMPEP_0185596150 /NCGR_PEP_ID=MMETSP0434-20130131/80593_1 /TAXON_ID=626734 ORGANISM="Favella taraikaensis, Strain Fe Narragansett Bay" /NCGR_SAMPLE_ID=MMETSP0434 /ASSEMBLY_ACC=CAM_ASM_000379 /LENGTH=164 /DNA_ID=CAMNT_0028224615 /DNA_START=281 /DNA_END=773 /DNA_ORIENTATION=-